VSKFIGPTGPVDGWKSADPKRAFTERHLADLTERFLDVIDRHPTLFALPEMDRVSAARVAARHALLAVRSTSIA